MDKEEEKECRTVLIDVLFRSRHLNQEQKIDTTVRYINALIKKYKIMEDYEELVTEKRQHVKKLANKFSCAGVCCCCTSCFEYGFLIAKRAFGFMFFFIVIFCFVALYWSIRNWFTRF
jgi:hypothetical protein